MSGNERPQSPTGMKDFWSEHHRELDSPGWGVEEFARMLAPAVRGKKVLDIGCGAGQLSALLADAGATVIGVDFVPELLALAEKRASALAPGRTAPRFLQQDLLHLDVGDTFDCICGAAILHEIPADSYPALLGRLRSHLAPGGFCVFQENSFFNPLYRLVRQRVVGRMGVPKVGSHDEIPFDQQRWDIVRDTFPHASRVCDTFVMFDRIWYQFLHRRVARVAPRVASGLGNACTQVDQLIARRIGDHRVTLFWSWLQTVYFSDSVSYKDTFRLTRGHRRS